MDASRNEEDEEEINEEGAKDKEGGVKSRGGEGPAWRGHPAVTLEIGARSDLGRHMAGQQQTHGLPTRCILISDQLRLLTSQHPPILHISFDIFVFPHCLGSLISLSVG